MFSAVIKMAIPTLVSHWRDGHTLKAATSIYVPLRAAAFDYAVALGIDVSGVDVPYAPRRSRPYATSADLWREFMNQRMRRDEW